jgi:hypothetical protein
MSLSNICKSGDVEKYKYYISKNDDINYNKTFINAFNAQHLDLMKEIYKSNNVKNDTFIKIFYQMLTNDNVEIYEWIKTLNLDINELSIRLVYYKLCENNDIKSVKWLYENYSFDICHNDVALKTCLMKKNNELAKWIINQPKYITLDVINSCCINNNIKLFEYSIKKNKYYMKNNKLCKDHMSCILLCIQQHNINMILHIYSISIIDDDTYLEHFIHACEHSHTELYEYLLEKKNDIIKEKFLDSHITHFSKNTLLDFMKNHFSFFDKYIKRLFKVCYEKCICESIDIIDINYEENKELIEGGFYFSCSNYDKKNRHNVIQNYQHNNDYLEYAKNLLLKYPLLDITHENNRVFEIACKNNSIIMCKWLMTKVEHYDFKILGPHVFVPNYKILIIKINDKNFTEECCVCYEISNCKLKCNHYVCSDCIDKLRKKICPMCIKPIISCYVINKKRKYDDYIVEEEVEALNCYIPSDIFQ